MPRGCFLSRAFHFPENRREVALVVLVKNHDKALMNSNMRHLISQRMLPSILIACLAGCAASPTAPANGTDPSKFVTAGLGKSVRIGTVAITPLSILEDSRCPANVQCIQAGTVRIAAKLQTNGTTETAKLGFMTPYQLGGRWIHLVAVCPYPVHPMKIAKAEYRFTFAVEQKAIGPLWAGTCNSPK